jgi:hypothetical protein
LARRRFTIVASLLVAGMAALPAHAAGKYGGHSDDAGGAYTGLGVGAMLPEGTFADFNDPGYFVQSRSLYVDKIFGMRAGAYYGETAGLQGAPGGRVYGFDVDALAKFGSPHVFGYVFAGAGYGKLTFNVAGPVPGSSIRTSGYEWCWTGGLGFTYKRKHGFYVEASYVAYQLHPAADFIPVVVGFQF